MKSLGINNPTFNLQSIKPNLNKVLAISFGLIFFSILSSQVVYAETYSVKIGDDNFEVQYTGNGISVNGIEPDLDFLSLIFSVEVTGSQGILQVTFDRNFFDSLYMGNDDEFIVLADGDEPSYSEIETTSTSRTLSITLPNGTEEVEIIGSIFGNPLSEPKPETPKPETPKPETPKPKIECGPGTILKGSVCVLDEKCGPGTVLQNGVCVVQNDSSPPQTLGRQLVYGFIAAFVIAGVVGIILGLMSKASKSS